jgi:hypothetical protein
LTKSEQWTIDEVAVFLGGIKPQSADQALRRKGILPVSREPGRAGKNIYDANEVRAAFPDRGPRPSQAE